MALQYKNIIGMKRAERAALVKGMDVVYIYHDTIDEASHTSDTSVFPACDRAISELKNMVRMTMVSSAIIWLSLSGNCGKNSMVMRWIIISDWAKI